MEKEEAQVSLCSPYPDVEIPELSLTEFVLGRAKALGDKPALIDGPTRRTLTYAGLAQAVRRVAAGLATRGFEKGDVFAMYAPNLPEYALAVHAVASLGGATTTVNPLYTVEELTRQLDDAGAKWLLTVPPFLETAREAAGRSGVREVFVFGEAEGATPFSALLAGGEEPPEVEIDPREDLVFLPYSSGTTGMPKGVLLTHRNAVANIAQVTAPGFDFVLPDDVVVAVLPFFHIYGLVPINERGPLCRCHARNDAALRPGGVPEDDPGPPRNRGLRRTADSAGAGEAPRG